MSILREQAKLPFLHIFAPCNPHGLQLGVGFTVAYLVYTIGTLITAPTTLAAAPAIAGGIAVVVMAGIVVGLIVNANKKVKAEYKLN